MSGATDPRSVTVLGCTGSVGRSTVDLLLRDPGAYRVEALVGNRNIALLVEQAKALSPRFVVTADASQYQVLADALAGTGIEVGAGRPAVIEAAQRPADWVMSAIVGAAGLEPTLAAARRGAVIGLANKETLVCAGDLMMRDVARHGATLLPVDSEHSAIFQVFDFAQADRVEKIILTASGGPFRTWGQEAMRTVTPAQAVAHPNWSMGAKISVDSATMMNKGLELIEAHHLFAMPEPKIDILVHPQSVIHSLVAYIDGSVLAQLGAPDMRTPIAYALGWPQRISTPCKRLDLAEVAQLTFEQPDPERFPALRLVREALRSGGAAPTVLNAANEVAVARFLGGDIGFLDIISVVEQVLSQLETSVPGSLEDVLEADAQARRMAAAACDAAA
ncbi:1-deoxy-D-xylulose-5-phosphate reductoisomerase [Novispirillum itersonii]|uniref:1-deoxy-D-xylulose 5-phosphate reductoisomerase n=1 Tax=Novispirillum itersonii TaxID=189 RepID=A0A7W9ZET9_NOVIT|nr:1-deoxy-D-xylulose-5-phosphate reductoisomerase [Novispirillum itersonii]MBB6210171.1 1-deoxy-D-xylulose-5-phosphate reductoisomerase [Novispirillum itersonii]